MKRHGNMYWHWNYGWIIADQYGPHFPVCVPEDLDRETNHVVQFHYRDDHRPVVDAVVSRA
jgi:cell wall assembly regulator SMI1